MNPLLEKRENSYASNEEVMHSPSFESLTAGLPFPDFVNNHHHASNGGAVLQQSHHSHYQSLLSELFNGSTQLPQSRHHQGLDHQAIYGTMTDFNYESSRKSHAASSIHFPTDYQVQHGDRLGTLHSKSTNLVPAHRGTSTGGNSYSSWRQGEFKHGDMFCSSNSHIGTTAVYSSMQSGGAATGKQRIRWTQELHEQFVEAVNQLGGAMKATPKGILALMKSRGLTVFHIKSHLQKYRTAKCMPNFLEGKNGKTINNDGMPISNFRRYGELQIYETLRLQMDIQKSLCEHLEFQKKLQMRIEEHTNYLERIFDQQQRSCSFFKNDNSTKAMKQSIAERSSIGEYENKVIPTKQEP